jgi:hypothetical protein
MAADMFDTWMAENDPYHRPTRFVDGDEVVVTDEELEPCFFHDQPDCPRCASEQGDGS